MLSVSDLITQATQSEFYQKALYFAEKVKLKVTSWEDGDPTKTQFGFLSESLATMSAIVASYTRSNFLSTAEGEWLKLRAEENFNYVAREKTYATCPMVLTNTKGGYYPFAEGDIIFRSSTTGKTYRNTTAGILDSGPGTFATCTIVADEPGKESDAGTGEIDALVTTMSGVTCANSEPAIALDEEDKYSIRANAKGSLKRLSLAGPRGIYAHIATNAELSGDPTITRATEYNAGNALVQLYIATTGGSASSGQCTTIAESIADIAQPGGITIIVSSATPQSLAVTYDLYVFDDLEFDDDAVKVAVGKRIDDAIAAHPIGGAQTVPGGPRYIIRSQLEDAVTGTYPGFFYKQNVSSPSTDLTVATANLCVVGGVHVGTIYRVARPK